MIFQYIVALFYHQKELLYLAVTPTDQRYEEEKDHVESIAFDPVLSKQALMFVMQVVSAHLMVYRHADF